MARGTKESKQAARVGAEFPYKHLMKHPAWSAVDRALGELESNSDLELQTARRYVVGYLVQQLIAQGLVSTDSESKTFSVGEIHEKLHAVR